MYGLALSILAAMLAPVEGSAVSAAVTGDWNGNGHPDRALLVERESTVDLHVYLDVDRPTPRAVVARGIGWRGGLWGTWPSLTEHDGALWLQTENDAIGRERWRRTLTIRWLDGELRVSAATHVAWDTIDNDQGCDCVLDFVTGSGTHDGQPVTVVRGPVPIGRWRDDASLCPHSPRSANFERLGARVRRGSITAGRRRSMPSRRSGTGGLCCRSSRSRR